MSEVASERVRDEWRARIAAEYTSAAVTQHLVLWLIQLGAPPDLIEQGLAIERTLFCDLMVSEDGIALMHEMNQGRLQITGELSGD